MRVTYALHGLLAASTTLATSYNPQHVVLGTDGTVVVGVDPSLYFRRAKPQIYRHHDQLESEQPSRLVDFDSELHDPKEPEAEELPLASLPVVYDALPDTDDIDSSIQVTQLNVRVVVLLSSSWCGGCPQEVDEDEFSSSAVFQVRRSLLRSSTVVFCGT